MINTEHKDRLFCFIFGREENKKWTLSLYNAVNGSAYTDPGIIWITTMDDVLYMGMKNDVSFIIENTMSIYEQQSTYNPNMPIRELMYAGAGKPEWQEGFSRMKKGEAGTADIEVRVRMLNVNWGKNRELLEACRPLGEYAWLIQKIQEYGKAMEIEEAVDLAIDEMPESYEIRKYLVGNKAEVKQMCITEYNEAETMQMFKEEGRKEGREEGIGIGEQSKAAEIAASMIRAQETGDKIVYDTGLKKEDVDRMAGELHITLAWNPSKLDVNM